MKINERIIESYKEVVKEDGTIEKIPVYRVVTRDMTPEEEAQYTIPESNEMKIARLKQELANTDYVVVKAYEREMNGESLSDKAKETIKRRDEIRKQINELENESK